MCDQSRCCPVDTLPVNVTSDYQHSGEKIQVNDFDVYLFHPESGENKSAPVIVMAYDIFGILPNALQVGDRIAQATNSCVVLPDFFRNEAWPHDQPLDREKLMAWISKAGSWEVIQADVEATIAALKEQRGYEVPKLGFVGFCWGGKQALRYASDPRFLGAATAHPSFLTLEDVEAAQCPLAILPSKDEPEMTELKEAMFAKDFGDKCVWKRFDDMPHGWCAARGDWSKEHDAKQASAALAIISEFFIKCFQ